MTPTPRMDELVRLLQKDNPQGDNWTVDLLRIGQDLERELVETAAYAEGLREALEDAADAWDDLKVDEGDACGMEWLRGFATGRAKAARAALAAKPQNRSFDRLRERMSPEARERAEQRTQELLSQDRTPLSRPFNPETDL